MESLYVIGGQQRTPRGMLVDEDVWYEYGKGVIMRVDPSSGTVTPALEYVSPPHACAEHEPQVLFKSATVHGDRLYACTQTEVIIYSLPGFEQLEYISLPCFNDLHHVRRTPEGNLLIANSGLDMVLEISHDGEVLREWSTLGEDPWSRFSRDIDYRKGVSTKPHTSHPNYVFYVGDEPWATRFQQRDAISLTHPERRIEVGLERMHDGVVSNGHVYFTTVDGKVVVADHERLSVEQVIDLNALHEDEALLGWCRSLHLDGDRAWVGFSRMRPTKFRENVSWVVHRFRRLQPTHIACYDLVQGRLIKEIDLEEHGLSAVFSILPGPASVNGVAHPEGTRAEASHP